MLPPRNARISGGILAGNVLPGYEIGGDWFDYIENRDGAWIGVADSMGKGTTAAALSASPSARFAPAPPQRPARRHCAGDPSHHAGSRRRGSLRQRDPRALARPLVDLPLDHLRTAVAAGHDGRRELLELDHTEHPSLGLGEPARRFTIDRRRLEPGERLLLISDGVLDRRTDSGEPFGLAGVRAAVAQAHDAAASTVRALEDAITAVSSDPLEDDATIGVFAPTDVE